MIEKVECIVIKCDNCGDIFEDCNGYSIFQDESCTDPEGYDWHVDEDGEKYYCPDCHTVDENDNVVLINVSGNDPVEK